MEDIFYKRKNLGFRASEKKRLIISLVITLIFMTVEIIGGFLTRSMALISDAFHMFTHAFAIGLSLGAILIARRPPCHHRTFGLYRAEILASFVNGLSLIPFSGLIIYYSIKRFLNPSGILGFEMFLIATFGLLANIASILILKKDSQKNINVRSVFFHLIGDVLSSIAVVVASILIVFKNWLIIDPIVSFGISLLIAYWAFSVLIESGKILLEMAPKGMNVERLAQDLKDEFTEIKEILNAHLWSITSDMLVFSAYIKFKNSDYNYRELLKRIDNFLKEKYPIVECTIQVEV